jgi:hypothetical protein
VDDLVRWWWNGRWGHLARKDVKIYREGDGYLVEVIEGGAEGRHRAWPSLPSEETALELAINLMSGSGSNGWKEMTDTVRRSV